MAIEGPAAGPDRRSGARCAARGRLPWGPLQLSRAIGPFVAGPRVVVRVERLLARAVRLRDVGQVHPAPVPERRAAAHPVDEDVRGLEMVGDPRVAAFPALESFERLGLGGCTRDL